VILWINGAFGSGKSSVAEEIAKRVNKSFIYDPEQVGYFLWDTFPDELKRKGNFQHLQIWRECNYKILKHIADNYDGMIIVPMTIYVKQYYDEIIGCLLKESIPVKHFILSTSKQTIINRLAQREEPSDGWAAEHIDVCIHAFNNDITEQKIDTESMDIHEIASQIILLTNLR